MDRQTDTWKDRQTDGQTDRRTDRRTDGQTDRHTDKLTDRSGYTSICGTPFALHRKGRHGSYFIGGSVWELFFKRGAILRVPRSGQAWPRGIFRVAPTDSGEGGGFTPESKMGKTPAFPPVYCIPPAKPAAPSVKCSGSPFFPWGVNSMY